MSMNQSYISQNGLGLKTACLTLHDAAQLATVLARAGPQRVSNVSIVTRNLHMTALNSFWQPSRRNSFVSCSPASLPDSTYSAFDRRSCEPWRTLLLATTIYMLRSFPWKTIIALMCRKLSLGVNRAIPASEHIHSIPTAGQICLSPSLTVSSCALASRMADGGGTVRGTVWAPGDAPCSSAVKVWQQ